ncbi:hypothetical protein GE09DRAFT_1244906 [Coniochaeta sp. 2T2.1]|nr:hypothetical protein GE09DRAFT_1244906 [Coniochaeta sp. 2T2.1]
MASRKRTASEALGLKDLVKKLKKQKNCTLDDFMVIGIDFGTTFSGAAWATVADFENNQINLVTTWPGTGREESKAPTELYYDENRVLWGYSIPADAEPLRWFKLLLLRDCDLTPEMRRSGILARATALLTEKNKTAVEVIGDYLRGLWKHVTTTIERARSKSVIDALKFHVVITVPAIWPDYARKDMMDAARKAGIFDYRPGGNTTLDFAPEPEAAALATLWDRAPELKKGDVYTICDAGGGTVDLISYKVHTLNPIQLHEAVIGTGGLCGGIFVDEAFEAMCKNRLGRRWRNLSQAGIKDIMRHEWESAVKPQFRLDDQSMEYIVDVPAEAFTGKGIWGLNDDSRKPPIKNGRIHFSSRNIQSAFDGAFHDIQALINSQIADAKKKRLPVKGIILVGGLGSSPYLYRYLHEKLVGDHVDILQATGIRPRTSICRGAIFKGFLEGPSKDGAGMPSAGPARLAVVSMIARKSLGVQMYVPFKAGVHLEEDKCWDDDEACWEARDQMTWYLRKGNTVSRKKPIRHCFYNLVSSHEDLANLGDKYIYECNDDTPPSRQTPRVTVLCSIRVKLDEIKYEDLEDFTTPDGRHMKKWSYDIEMVPSGASTEFAIYCEGKKVGSEKIEVEFQ